MLYLRTGANGSCKTLFTLADVRALQLKESRPVCINGRFKIKPEKLLEFGWKVIDFKDWQAQDDGTIFLIDECHNDMPVRPNSAPVPPEIRMLAEHRARGFDFFLLTQHPMNIDAFVRKLVGAPGWHQHLKRQFGGTSVTRVLQWDAVNAQCEKDGSGGTAQITTRVQPKEVFDWYESASLHTAKVRIPFQMKMLAVCLVVVPLLGYFGWQAFKNAQPGAKGRELQGHGLPGQPAGAPAPSQEKHVTTAAEYVATFQPRIPGLQYTAARYDDATKPVHVPYPAACVSMGDRCQCYTQQATKLEVPMALCKQIVAGGFFMDWENAYRQAQNGSPVVAQSGAVQVQPQGPSDAPRMMPAVALASESPPRFARSFPAAH